MSVVTEALASVAWRGKKILVACSGGVDSMVLLHGLLGIGEKPAVLHVDYQLRGTESDLDRQLVVETAERSGLACTVYTCPPERIKKEGVNLQSAARDVRRVLFREWTARSPEHVVVLAHHADDQVETFFLQLLRGSGTFGLGGMHPERGQLIRPFLDIPKQELYAYARAHGIGWREDRSNAGSSYRRNLLRNELLPPLLETNPELRESILFLMRQFRGRQLELTASVQPMIAAWERSGVGVPQWLGLSAEQKLAFVHAVGLPVWAIARFDRLAAGENGTRFLVGGLSVWKEAPETMRALRKAPDPSWDYKIEEVGILPDVFDKESVYLDAEKIVGELQLRAWRQGDRIKSIGLEGSQLVSDVLKDAGIPAAEKEKIPILTDNAEILWIPGVKVGRTAVATDRTTRIWRVSLVVNSCK